MGHTLVLKRKKKLSIRQIKYDLWYDGGLICHKTKANLLDKLIIYGTFLGRSEGYVKVMGAVVLDDFVSIAVQEFNKHIAKNKHKEAKNRIGKVDSYFGTILKNVFLREKKKNSNNNSVVISVSYILGDTNSFGETTEDNCSIIVETIAKHYFAKQKQLSEEQKQIVWDIGKLLMGDIVPYEGLEILTIIVDGSINELFPKEFYTLRKVLIILKKYINK